MFDISRKVQKRPDRVDDTDRTAKQCTLIAVNEIIEQWDYIDTYLADDNGGLNPNLKYWYDVRTVVNAL